MLPVQLLRRYFSNIPDWILGGFLLIVIIWLIVLPIELVNILIYPENFIPENNLGWLARILYIKGYMISMTWIPSLREIILSEQALRLAVVLMGLFISSFGYFIVGALLSIRKVQAIALGALLVTINAILSFYVIIGLSILSSG